MEKKFPNYITWHFFVVPNAYLLGLRNYLAFNFHFFSTTILLKTLFAPWKRKTTARERTGFDVSEWFTVLTFNFISRFIGLIIRLALIFWALLAELALIMFGSLVFLLILFTPVLSLPTFLASRKSRDEKKLSANAAKDPKSFIIWFLDGERGKFAFQRLGIKAEEVRRLVEESNNLNVTLNQTLNSNQKISEVFLQIAKSWPPLHDVLVTLKLEFDDLSAVLEWFDREEEEKERKSRFWAKENLLRQPALATDWSFGYTVNLDKYSTDLTKKQSFASHLIGRDTEVERIETVLCRSGQNNVLLVGQEGVGKRTVVLQFSQNIVEGKVYPPLKHKRVLEVNVNNIIGEGKTPIQAQNLFEAILKEAIAAGNIILEIPRIDRFLASDNERVDLSSVLGTLSGLSRVQIIGITSPEMYHKYIYPNSTVGKLFEVVEIAPPDKQTAIKIAETFVSDFENGKNVLITYQAIKEAVNKSDRYITETPFPEKVLELLDEAVVTKVSQGGGIITEKEIDETLSVKTKVPVGEISKAEKDKLINLESIIHKRLVDQEEAVKGLANAFRRARLDLESRKKPAGVFLFLGPTGVGKTETAKALAEAYFGGEERLVRLDMNEFQDDGANIRLLGYFEKNEPGILTKLLRDHPFCVLLLDEIEKASKQVLNLLLTAFDEGYINDNFGKKLSLKEIVIVCTSNAGSEFIRQKVNAGVGVDDFKKELIDYLMKQSIFSPEFLNRFDDIVVYKPLSFADLKEIARMNLNALNKKLEEKKVSIKITESLLEKIAKEGFDPVFGARPMSRLIVDKIASPLAEKLLRGEVEKGEIEIDF